MASYFNIILDTLGPSGVNVKINGDAIYTSSLDVTLTITVADEDTTGYQMKIWGLGINGPSNADDAEWETYTETKSIALWGEDGLKTVYVKVRDDVGNESGIAEDTITLNTSVPKVTVSGPDRAKISEVDGFNTAIINFMSDVPFIQYKVCGVTSVTTTESNGIQIGSANGSINISGEKTDGEVFAADTNIEVSINASDLKVAAGGSDGVIIVKVFVKNEAGTWSVA